MNLSYVKDYLNNIKEHVTPADIDVLITEINTYQGTENTFKDISKVMRTINEYNLSFITQVEEYESFPKNDSKFIQRRAEKAREILCTLSLLHTYLTLSINSVKESTYNMKNVRAYITELTDKRDHFKSEKMTWVTVLKSLTQEMSYIIEIKRLDIEKEMGYVKRNG